jgi:hypothetical protein
MVIKKPTIVEGLSIAVIASWSTHRVSFSPVSWRKVTSRQRHEVGHCLRSVWTGEMTRLNQLQDITSALLMKTRNRVRYTTEIAKDRRIGNQEEIPRGCLEGDDWKMDAWS